MYSLLIGNLIRKCNAKKCFQNDGIKKLKLDKVLHR